MEAKVIIDARKKAEKAVSDMPEGELKVKAFEVIFSKLLDRGASGPSGSTMSGSQLGVRKPRAGALGLQGRILELTTGGFFSEPKIVNEVKLELASAGFHHKYSDVAVSLLRLTRKKVLRRIPYTEKGKQVYRYCLP